MNAIAVPPEAELNKVAGGDFSGLSMPLLVACRDANQLEEFVFRAGLVCSNVQRLRQGMMLGSYPENKVLILLPGYWEDGTTEHLVDHWAGTLDRYTCEVEDVPTVNAALAGFLALIALVTVGSLIYQTIKP